jgi:hypothetical protein
MSLLMYQRLEPTGEHNKSVEYKGGLFVRLEHIEAAVPTEKLVRVKAKGEDDKKYIFHNLTELHMISGTKHLVSSDISKVLEDINVTINK